MTVLDYPINDKWFEIQDWIDKNSNGNVGLETWTRMTFHSGLAQELHESFYRVTFSNSDDALFCKIKYPPE